MADNAAGDGDLVQQILRDEVNVGGDGVVDDNQ